jgi:hypothetical protein
MPHNPTTLTAWVTPQQYNSGEVATSTNYNNLVNDVGLLYAKPWMTAWLSSALGSTATNVTLFQANTSTLSNSPASAAGSIVYTSGASANFTVPVAGLYRVTMHLSSISQSTSGTFSIVATASGGATANNYVFQSPRTLFSSVGGTDSEGSFVIPMSAVGTTGAFATTLTFSTGSSATSTGYNGNAGPSISTATRITIEYLGTSTGSI